MTAMENCMSSVHILKAHHAICKSNMACVAVHGTLGAGVREVYILTKHTCIATF